MKSSNYVVNRDDILVGQVYKSIDRERKIYPEGSKKRSFLFSQAEVDRYYESMPWLLENKPQIFFPGNIRMVERSMLFVLENTWSNDLLYDSPAYPVCNISSLEDCTQAAITVSSNIYRIGRVLEYLGYPQEITLEDSIRIKETLFSVDWIIDNAHLFGVYETYNDSANFLFDSQHRPRCFNDWRDDGPIPESYYWAFAYNKQHRFFEGMDEREDFFAPGPNEGKIKRLY